MRRYAGIPGTYAGTRASALHYANVISAISELGWEESRGANMRKTLLTLIAGGAIGLAGISAASAAPLSAAPLNQGGAAVNDVTQVQHWRWGSGGHWRWGSRGGHWRWGSRGGHWRWGSRGRRW